MEARSENTSLFGRIMINFSKEGRLSLYYKRKLLCSGEKGLELQG